jgi:hypothetical protein
VDQEFIYRQKDGSSSEVLTADELTRLALNGLLMEETMVANPGWENWVPAWRVPFLQHAFGLSFHEPAPAAATVEEAPAPRPAPGPKTPDPEPVPEPRTVLWNDFLLGT